MVDSIDATERSAAEASIGQVEEGAFFWTENVAPSEDQLRVAKSLGAEDTVLARMRDKGMDRSTYYHVVPAEAAETHMTEKYGIAFTATDAVVEDAEGENCVRVTVRPAEGASAGSAFTVRARWETGRVATFTENYFASARTDEYAQYMDGRLADVVAACPHEVFVVPAMGSFLAVGDEYGPDTPIERVAAECDGRLLVVFGPSDGFSEDAYREELGTLFAAAAEVNPSIFYEAGAIERLEEGDEELDAAGALGYLHASRDERWNLCVWRVSGAVGEGVGDMRG